MSDYHKCRKILVDSMVIPERTSILSTNIQGNAESTESFSGNAVRMTSRNDIWSRLMNCTMNQESSSINSMHVSAFTDFALLIHENEIGYFHVFEALEERIDPEVVG